MVKSLVMPNTGTFTDAERNAVYRTIEMRRDVRHGFLDRPLPDDLLQRLLAAAHSAPSVGFMQPSRFILIRDLAIRKAVRGIFEQSKSEAAANYAGHQLEQYSALKLEGILEAPLNICVVCDTGSEHGHKLGRHSMPETAAYSTVCAIQNLWLAARAEGVGVGWVSILDPLKLRPLLRIPDHILPVAYLCLGYVDEFAPQPELETFGWQKRLPLASVISYNHYSEDKTR